MLVVALTVLEVYLITFEEVKLKIIKVRKAVIEDISLNINIYKQYPLITAKLFYKWLFETNKKVMVCQLLFIHLVMAIRFNIKTCQHPAINCL